MKIPKKDEAYLCSNQDFIQELLHALEDEDVKRRIIDIAEITSKNVRPVMSLLNQNEKEVDELRQKTDQYSEKIQQLEKQLKEMSAAQEILVNENACLKERHQHLLEQYHQKVTENEELRNSFKDARQCYDAYLSLPLSVKASLKGVFKGSTIEEFFVCGVQYDNLESFWEFIKLLLLEEKETNIEELISIFQYFFQAFSKIYDNPLYVFDDTKFGQQFDHEIHIRTGSSKVMGPISKVLLQGFHNSKTNKIVKKTVVKV